MNNVQYPRLLAVLPRLLAVMVITISATAIAQTAVPLVNQPLAPVSAAPGSGAFTLTVNGTGFVSGAVVNWNGSARTTTFISSSSLQASITATDVANKGTATVNVVNPGAGGGISNRVYFPIRTPLSSVAAVVDNKLSGVAPAAATVAGDFDNDGKQDFVTCVNNSTGNFLYFYRGNGGGAFGTPIITTANNLSPIAYLMTGDFNNDGNLDLLVGDSGGADLVASAVFLGDGHGHFHQKPLLAKNLADFGFPTAIGDFNGDGKLDVLYFGQSEDDTALFTILGNGDGTFQPATPTKSIPGLYLWMTVGDFNGDGKLDVAGSTEFGQSVTIYLGNGDGTFTAGDVYEETATGMGAADVNGDGKLDLVFNGFNANLTELCVQLGVGDGTFASATCSGSGGLNLQFADFNGDGKVDVLGSNFINLGNGDGTFQPPVTLAFLESASTGVADFNGDGQLDFVSTSRGPGGPVQVLLQGVLGFSASIFGFATHNVGSTSSPQTLTLSNVGTRRLNIASISLTGANPGDFIEHNACGTGIRPGGTCNVQLAFKPTADGARTASLTVTYSGLGNPQSVALLGTGTH